jgi:hypothetical protein
MSQVITRIVDLLRRWLVRLCSSIARVVISILFRDAVRFIRVALERDSQFHEIFFLLLCTVKL